MRETGRASPAIADDVETATKSQPLIQHEKLYFHAVEKTEEVSKVESIFQAG